MKMKKMNRRNFLAISAAFALAGMAACSEEPQEQQEDTTLEAPRHPQAPFQSFEHLSGRIADHSKPQLVIFSMAWDSPMCGPDRDALANVLRQLDANTRSNLNVTMIVPDYKEKNWMGTANIAAFLAEIPEGEVIASNPLEVYNKARAYSVTYVNYLGMMGPENWQEPPVSHTRAFLLLDAQGNRLGTYFSDVLSPSEIVQKIRTELSASNNSAPDLGR